MAAENAATRRIVKHDVHDVPGYGAVYPRETRTVTFHGETLGKAMAFAAAWLELHEHEGAPVSMKFFQDAEPVALEPGGPKNHIPGYSLHLTCDC